MPELYGQIINFDWILHVSEREESAYLIPVNYFMYTVTKVYVDLENRWITDLIYSIT